MGYGDYSGSVVQAGPKNKAPNRHKAIVVRHEEESHC